MDDKRDEIVDQLQTDDTVGIVTYAFGSDIALQESEFGFLKLRHKKPSSDASELISLPIPDASRKTPVNDILALARR